MRMHRGAVMGMTAGNSFPGSARASGIMRGKSR